MVTVAGPSKAQAESTDAGPSSDTPRNATMSEVPPSSARNFHFRPFRESQQSAIGLRRLRSNTSRLPPVAENQDGQKPDDQQQLDDSDDLESQISRHDSAPQRPTLEPGQPATAMPSISERVRGGDADPGLALNPQRSRWRPTQSSRADEYDPRIVDILDVIGRRNSHPCFGSVSRAGH